MSEKLQGPFTTTEVAAILGETVHTVIGSYIKRGYVEPSIQQAKGHGSRRLFSFTDLVKLLIAQYLRTMKLEPEKIRTVMQFAETDPAYTSPGSLLIVHESREIEFLYGRYDRYKELGVNLPFVGETPINEIFDPDEVGGTVISVERIYQRAEKRIVERL